MNYVFAVQDLLKVANKESQILLILSPYRETHPSFQLSYYSSLFY